MKQHYRAVAALVTMAVITLLSQSGCKENTLVNSKVYPSNDSISFHTDTLPVLTKTFLDFSVNTSNYLLPKALGVINDPTFGQTIAGLYFNLGIYGTQVTLDHSVVNGVAPDNTIVVDSAVLVVPYSGFTYGDSTNATLTQSFRAYQVNTPFVPSDTLSYFTKPLVGPISEAVSVNLYHLRDSVTINGVKYGPHLRIKLTDDVVTKFSHFTSATTDSAFKAQFNGVYIASADSNSASEAMPYFSLITGSTDPYSQAGVVVYYHSSASTFLTQYYPFNTASGNYNTFSRHYSGTPVGALLGSTAASDSIVGIQNQAGTAVDVKIYNLASIPKNVVINYAALQLTVKSDGAANDSLYGPVALLLPKAIHSYGQVDNIYDHLGVNSAYLIDGAPITTTVNGQTIKTYMINMPQEIQRSLQQDTVHLHILGNALEIGAFRMLLYGGNSGINIQYRAKMIVTYTKLH